MTLCILLFCFYAMYTFVLFLILFIKAEGWTQRLEAADKNFVGLRYDINIVDKLDWMNIVN